MKKLNLRFFKKLDKKIDKMMDMDWTPSFNLFSDILVEELKSLAGYEPREQKLSLAQRNEIAAENLKTHLDEKPEEREKEKVSFPPEFSWLDVDGKNYVTSVKNQGFCSSCVAFGTLAVVETMMRIKEKKPVNTKKTDTIPGLSEAQLFFKSPGFSMGPNSEDTHNCKTGWEIDDALRYLVEPGVVPEDVFPYELEDKSQPMPDGWKEKTTKITGFMPLNSHSNMKQWISKVGPLVTAMTIKADLVFYGKGIYSHIFGPALGGHCVTVVGYNDEYQAWLCKNSWSEHWGEEGFFWIKYGECGIDAEMWGITGIS